MEANKGKGAWVIDSYSGYPVRQLAVKLELNVRTNYGRGRVREIIEER